MPNLSDVLAAHHEACDQIFAAAERAAERGDWDACAAQATAFSEALATHFATEEDTLFPGFEEATGMTMGPTMVMRDEHGQMRALIGDWLAAARAGNEDDFFGTSETLLIFMEQHNRKEEGILYPMCDAQMPGATELATGIAARLGV